MLSDSLGRSFRTLGPSKLIRLATLVCATIALGPMLPVSCQHGQKWATCEASAAPLESVPLKLQEAGSADDGAKRYWTCSEVSGSCFCDNSARDDTPLTESASCSTRHCCMLSVSSHGYQTCSCVTEKWLSDSSKSCQERVAAPCSPGFTCTPVATCPPAATQ